jgi:hypothetical protein
MENATKITIKLKNQPFSHLDRKLRRPDPENGHTGYVGRSTGGAVMLFGSAPCLSGDVFYPCSGYSLALYLSHQEIIEKAIGKPIGKCQLIPVKVVW